MDPAKPQLITRYSSPLTDPGVHTAEVQRVNGKLYAFLCIDPSSTSPARLVIVDLSNPSSPQQVFTAAMGSPYVHDVFVRDGILITALWNQGITVWDIGGGGHGAALRIRSARQCRDCRWKGAQRLVVSQCRERREAICVCRRGGSWSDRLVGDGDIHVVDVSNFAAPREVAFYHVDGAGTHNFSMDEARGILYAAYYNGGVRAISVTGDLSNCDAAARSTDGRCDLVKMGRELGTGPTNAGPVYIWGVQLVGTHVFASDMLNGIWKLDAVP